RVVEEVDLAALPADRLARRIAERAGHRRAHRRAWCEFDAQPVAHESKMELTILDHRALVPHVTTQHPARQTHAVAVQARREPERVVRARAQLAFQMERELTQ